MTQQNPTARLALVASLLLAFGCDGSATSYSRLDLDAGDRADLRVEGEAPQNDDPPEIPLEECPWLLSGCFSMISEMECGPFGCEAGAPTRLWVDALPCHHAPVDVFVDDGEWRVSNKSITDEGYLAFDLAFEGAGQTRCVIDQPDEHYYPDKLRCAQGDGPPWVASLFENPSLCTDCPQLEGCYTLHGFEEAHSVALVQEGCAFQLVSEPHEGRSLQPSGAIGPTGNMIFRSVGQVADNVCALTTDDALGLACAATYLGQPAPIVIEPDVRLETQSWDQCPSVGCLEDADCLDDPLGRTCDFGRCVCTGRSPCDEGQVCVSNNIEENACVAGDP